LLIRFFKNVELNVWHDCSLPMVRSRNQLMEWWRGNPATN
jgi:hypothetical protein